MELYFDIIPVELNIEILTHVNYNDYINLLKISPIYIDMNDKTYIWKYLINNNKDYFKIMDALNNINEKYSAENLRDVYFGYLNNLFYFRRFIDKSQINLSSFNKLKNEPYQELNKRPLLIKIWLYINFPGIYHRIVKLIDPNFMHLKYSSNYDKYDDLTSILISLIYANSLECENNIIRNYIKYGRLDYYPALSDIVILKDAHLKTVICDRNWLFLWLYTNEKDYSKDNEKNIHWVIQKKIDDINEDVSNLLQRNLIKKTSLKKI